MKDHQIQKCFSSSWVVLILLSAVLMMPFSPNTAGAEGWKAGTAAVVITPEKPVWMSGYPPTRPEIGYVPGDRNTRSTGKIHDLYVKALAIEDPHGNRAVIMTADLSGINTDIGTRVKNEIQRKYGISSKAILLNASHTHCGPTYSGSRQRDNDLTDWMEQRFLEVISKAVENMKPSELTFSKVLPIQPSSGTGPGMPPPISYKGQSFWAPFAVSRRLPTTEGIKRNYPQVLSYLYTGGLRDDTIPVLRVAGPDGAIKAILFGYACHPITLIGTLLSGDYPGFAQSYIEEAYPGANVMFAQGCAGNLCPALRYQVEYAMGQGRALAYAVKQALESDQQPITGAIRFDSDVVPIDLQPVSGREELVRTLPVQVLRIGNEVLMIGLPGEPVVEYANRFKSEFLTQFTWVMGYCGSFGYLPTWRILKEGGYEARTPFAETVESQVVEGVKRLVNHVMEDI